MLSLNIFTKWILHVMYVKKIYYIIYIIIVINIQDGLINPGSNKTLKAWTLVTSSSANENTKRSDLFFFQEGAMTHSIFMRDVVTNILGDVTYVKEGCNAT